MGTEAWPQVVEAATPRTAGCNPTEQRLQPYAMEASALCNGGCNPMQASRPPPPQLRVTLNGGLEGLPALRAAAATPGLDGLMCGR